MALTKTTQRMTSGGFVHVNDFGADPTGVADSTTAIQAAINHAATFVTSQPDGSGDPVNGRTVLFDGVYKVTDPITVYTSNIVLQGRGGSSIFASMQNSTGYNGSKPVFIIGDELWQASNSITGARKYQGIHGINIVRDINSPSSFVGVLVSGTRNFSASNMLIERGNIGMLFENTSEANVQQISAIGCNWGFLCDNRYNRSASDSVRNIASVDNDVSSNKFTMLSAYYAQHTGFLFLNSGGNTVDSMTVGLHGDNPAVSPPLGLPSASAGIHVCGTLGNSNWTRSNLIEGVHFEPSPSRSDDCIRIDSTTSNEPVVGVTIDSCHVQTYASDHAGGNVTTFLRVVETTPGDIMNVRVRDSGFTFQSSGYYYGNLIEASGTPDVVIDRCYPDVALATSVMTSSITILEEEVLQRTDLSSFPPSGWTSSGTTTGVSVEGGSSGVQTSVKIDGDTGAITMYEDVVYREYKSDFNCPFISFEARGDADLILTAEVNGVSVTLSSTKSGDNIGRYSNAIIDQNVLSSTEYRKFYFTFNQFSANYGFDTVRWTIGKEASTAAEFIEVKNVKIGYLKGHAGPYNPF